MPTTWPSMTANDPVTGKGVKGTIGTALYDRAIVMGQGGVALHVGSADLTATSTSSTNNVYSANILMPKWMITGRTIRLFAFVKQTGAVTASFRVGVDSGGTPVFGTTDSTPNAGFTVLKSIVTMTGDGLADTETEIDVYLWGNDANGVSLSTVDIGMNMSFAD